MAVTLSLWLSRRVCAAVARSGVATRGVVGLGPFGREPDSDSDWEPEERELQEVESTLKRQRKAIRFQKIRRQMEASGSPPRTLTWAAMEQIRKIPLWPGMKRETRRTVSGLQLSLPGRRSGPGLPAPASRRDFREI
ncbi:neugrin isoform X2 [Otolemur garnettii]|uniref:neugrin isoform X2 n=1 Tax=Otolemur garnettii TaxID=30611 RepID=UPI000C7F1EFD|nr:neugrin isoform X2 [Otolemur garnettii]